jgi:hypothetical protein
MSLNESHMAIVRLHARHKGEPLTPDLIEYFCEDLVLNEAEIYRAYAQGLADRESGARCLCPRCELDFTRITANDELRSKYRLKRRDELRAQGLTESAITMRIDDEIRGGAALRGTTHQ